LVQCPEATPTQLKCLRQTDRQTDRHTVRAAPGAVLAPGPEAMWKARSGFSSTRTHLSPFTKEFRGGEHPRVYGIFGSSASAEHHLSVYTQVCSLLSSLVLWLGPLCSSGLFRRAWWWFPKAWRLAPESSHSLLGSAPNTHTHSDTHTRTHTHTHRHSVQV